MGPVGQGVLYEWSRDHTDLHKGAGIISESLSENILLGRGGWGGGRGGHDLFDQSPIARRE